MEWKVVVSILVMFPLAASAAGAVRQAWPRVHVHDPLGAWAIRLALDGASRRLAEPGCQAIFSDYRDEKGRRLSEKLAGLGVSAQSYLEWIVFYDGTDMPACEASDAMAVTAPGSRIVYVCARRFARESRTANGSEAENTVVHEVLHTLGLGENPPASREISRRVSLRCGR